MSLRNPSFPSATWNGSNRNSSLNSNPGDLFEKTLRNSSSFNVDAAPPSYFEAIGIQSNTNYATIQSGNAIYLNVNNTEQPQDPSNMIIDTLGGSNNELSFNSNKPTPPRHQIIRTRNLTPNSPYYNYSNGPGNPQTSPSEAYLIWSIFTSFYCIFIGLFALIFSIKVRHYNKHGDYQKAHSASKLARNFNIGGLFFGLVYLAVGLLACFLPIER